jgi:hypothetical protein
MRTYRLHYTQRNRKGAILDGSCQRKDGQYYTLLTTGEIKKGVEHTRKVGEIWNFKLSTFLQITSIDKIDKFSWTLIHVPEKHDIDKMTTEMDRNQAVKMQNLISFIRKHPLVAEYDHVTNIQKNENFNVGLTRGINYVLVDQTAIEEKAFNNNREQTKAIILLDELYDNCLAANDFTELVDICFGLNLAVKPQLNEPMVNYNKAKDFIALAPKRFVDFVSKKSESQYLIVFRKAITSFKKESNPIITFKNGSYYFGEQIIGKDETEVIYFFKTNTKVFDYLLSATQGKLTSEEVADKIDIELGAKESGAIDEETVIETNTDAVEEITAAVDKAIERLEKHKGKATFENLKEKIKVEANAYDESQKIMFIDVFNAKAKLKNIDLSL